MIRIALIQLRVDQDETPETRLKRVLSMNIPQEVDILVLPELWLTGAFIDATDNPVDFVESFRKLSENKSILIIAGSVTAISSKGLENSIAIFDHGEYLKGYSKLHLFGLEGQEKEKISSGNVINILTRHGLNIGLSICYDLRFPELYRRYREEAVDVFVIPASWPAPRIQHWETLLRARAIENQALVVGCNAIGNQGEIILGGMSLVIGPNGEIRAQASPNEEELIIVEFDESSIKRVRESFPVYDDTRSDYPEISLMRI